mmetsp:Transcript_19440/g.61851  ORF Transcript_19440/g.61851 Transcript_19440/m.61851 type:complete len:308 (+) Transcript_19440:146-1069(+)
MLSQGAEAEANEMMMHSQTEALPSTLADVRSHPLYCIAKHLGKHEALPPDARSVGKCRGEDVFLRSLVREAYSERQWYKRGRVVREAERLKPAKWYKPVASRARRSRSSRGRRSGGSGAAVAAESGFGGALQSTALGDGAGVGAAAAASADAEEGEEEVDEPLPTLPEALFGVWQTDALAPDPIPESGDIPRNKYGNIELWTDAHLPAGAVHLRGGWLANAARKLGVSYAPAMVGFDGNGASARPVIDGIVVAEAVAGAVRAAQQQLDAQREERKAKRVSKRALGNWERVVKALRVKLYVARRYGTQ